MLQKGGKINAASSNEFAPLHLAAYKGDIETAAFLLDHLERDDFDASGRYRFHRRNLAIVIIGSQPWSSSYGKSLMF